MSDLDRTKWNKRYIEGAYKEIRHPSALLKTWLPRLGLSVVPPARVLDLAAGAGRNSLFLAHAGLDVLAVDISESAIAQLRAVAVEGRLSVATQIMDLDSAVQDPRMLGTDFDLILMIRYWDEALLSAARQQLAPGGTLLVEAHLQVDSEVAGPKRRRFRAPPGALRQVCEGMDMLHYEESIRPDPDGRDMALASLVARRLDYSPPTL